ncbi:MAG: PDZ domain-containing protein, partial [Vulcanococcus sp.]
MAGVLLAALLCAGTSLPPLRAESTTPLQVPQPQQRRPRLGVYLESDTGGVWVRQVAPGSVAEQAGLKAGDRILELDVAFQSNKAGEGERKLLRHQLCSCANTRLSIVLWPAVA